MNFINAQDWIRQSAQRAEELRQQAARDALVSKPKWRLTRPERVALPQPVAMPCPAK
jgi:hypothetical protein